MQIAVGQVGFKNQKMVKRILVAQRENPIVNRLNKTKLEKFPDLRQEKEDKLKALRKKDQAVQLERVSDTWFCSLNIHWAIQKRKEEARIAQERKEKKWQKDHAYDDIFQEEENMKSNQEGFDEDDFMWATLHLGSKSMHALSTCVLSAINMSCSKSYKLGIVFIWQRFLTFIRIMHGMRA